MRSLDIAGTGMHAQQTNVEVISNNIANMTTTGYKRRRAEFQDLIYQNLRRVGSNSSDTGTIVPAGAQIGLGVKTGLFAMYSAIVVVVSSRVLMIAASLLTVPSLVSSTRALIFNGPKGDPSSSSTIHIMSSHSIVSADTQLT